MEIAKTVIDRHRTFPNAITLATDSKDFTMADGSIELPDSAKMLVVDGQHRLWAQHYSDVPCAYACIIHLQKTEQQMAELFLEINDNQRRVPASLRWDLVRLVRPHGDEAGVMASELVLELATRKESPFFVAIDLTGERKDVIKQGSLAPELKTLVSRVKRHLHGSPPNVDEFAMLLIRFFVGVRSLQPQTWGDPNLNPYYKARVLRALIRVLADLAVARRSLDHITADFSRRTLARINPDTLSQDRIRASQGSAGVIDLYKAIKEQIE